MFYWMTVKVKVKVKVPNSAENKSESKKVKVKVPRACCVQLKNGQYKNTCCKTKTQLYIRQGPIRTED